MTHEYPFLVRGAADAPFLAHVDGLIDENIANFQPNGSHKRFWSFTDGGDSIIQRKKLELIEHFGIVNWIGDTHTHDFIGMIDEGGVIRPHTDPNLDGRLHVRINVIVRMPDSGCVPLLDDIPIDVGLGDAWLCFSGRCCHATTPVSGTHSRSALSYGLQVEQSAIFPLLATYLAWRSHASMALR